MKLLLLTDGVYPFEMGGMQKHSFNLAKYFVNAGDSVHLLHCVVNAEDLPDSNSVERAIFSKETKGFTSEGFVFPKVNSNKIPGHYLRNSRALSKNYWETIKDTIGDYDFVYSQGFTAWAFLENKAKCPPIGINFHGYNMFQKSFGIKSKLESVLLANEVKKYAKLADFMISLGGNLNKIITKELSFSESKLLVSPNGVDKKWVEGEKKKEKSERSFVYVGRWDKVKAIDLIYKAIERVGQNAHFYFIGPIDSEHQLHQSNVSYLGEIRNEDEIKSILSSKDILLCPSYSEGMPTAILEAMSSKMAIIATDVGAVNSLVQNEKNGTLIAVGSVSLLEEAILQYVNMSEETLRSQQAFSQQLVQAKFVWEKVIEDTRKDIKGVVEG